LCRGSLLSPYGTQQDADRSMHTHPQLVGYQSGSRIVCEKNRRWLLNHQSECFLLSCVEGKCADQGCELAVLWQ